MNFSSLPVWCHILPLFHSSLTAALPQRLRCLRDLRPPSQRPHPFHMYLGLLCATTQVSAWMSLCPMSPNRLQVIPCHVTFTHLTVLHLVPLCLPLRKLFHICSSEMMTGTLVVFPARPWELDEHSAHNSYWIICIKWMRKYLLSFLPTVTWTWKQCKEMWDWN